MDVLAVGQQGGLDGECTALRLQVLEREDEGSTHRPVEEGRVGGGCRGEKRTRKGQADG
jgi:hypothetical protein